jgi:hypothetical protein
MTYVEIQPGSDFCRVLRATDGQQILLSLDNGASGSPILLASASFILAQGACLFKVDTLKTEEEILLWIDMVQTESLARAEADKIQLFLKEQLAATIEDADIAAQQDVARNNDVDDSWHEDEPK